MNLELMLPILSQMIGRDLSQDIMLFNRFKQAAMSPLTPEAQTFLGTNWKTIVDFMETEEGKKATVTFLNSWVTSLVPNHVENTGSPQTPEQVPEQVQPES